MAFINQDLEARERIGAWIRPDTEHDQARRQQQVYDAAQGRPNPAQAYARSQVPGATNAEIQEGAARAHWVMYE